MKRYGILPILLLWSFHYPASAQSTAEVFAGMHYHLHLSQNAEDDLWEHYWNPSLNGGVRLDFRIAPSVNLTSSLFLNHYLFNRNIQGIAAPDSERVFVALSGDGSNVLRTMIEIQLIDRSDSFVSPYLEIGGGHVWEKMGTLHGKIEYLKYIAYSTDLTLPDHSYFAYTIGGGGLVSLSAAVVVDLSLHYYSNTKDRSYYLFGVGIGYEL